MTFIRRIFGIIVLLTALFGIALSVGCTIYGSQALDVAAQQSVQTIELVQTNIVTTNEALELAQKTVGDVNTSLDTVQGTADNLSTSIDDIDPLLDQISNITTERVPDSLEAVEETLPNIAEVAGTVDNTLSALSNFGFNQELPFIGTIDFDLGIDYDPETRFDESIETMGASLEGLPEQLRTLEPELVTTQENLDQISADIDTLAGDISTINDNLRELPPLLGEYIDSLDTVNGQLGDVTGLIGEQLEAAKLGLLILSIWFGLIQLAPLYIGWQMVTAPSTRALKEDIKEDLFEEIEEDLEQIAAEPVNAPQFSGSDTIIAEAPNLEADPQAGEAATESTAIAEADTSSDKKPFDPNETIVDESATKE